MLRAVVTYGSSGPEVFLTAGGEEGSSGTEYTAADCEFPPEDPTAEFTGLGDCGPGPSPIVPEMKEFVWGAGSFLIFAIVLRYMLYPRLRRSIDARYQSVRDGHSAADAERASASAEVAAYESALAGVRAEASARIEAARATLESERAAQLAEVNARVAARKESAAAAARAELDAARSQVGTAVASVAARTVELATGKSPDPNRVSAVVEQVMGTGVAR